MNTIVLLPTRAWKQSGALRIPAPRSQLLQATPRSRQVSPRFTETPQRSLPKKTKKNLCCTLILAFRSKTYSNNVATYVPLVPHVLSCYKNRTPVWHPCFLFLNQRAPSFDRNSCVGDLCICILYRGWVALQQHWSGSNCSWLHPYSSCSSSSVSNLSDVHMQIVTHEYSKTCWDMLFPCFRPLYCLL